jgi:pyruvate ferredoxin oxidoreductase beta subunit
MDALGKDTIVTNATGCLEVTTSKMPTSAWKVPWLHANFENAAATATGILAALKTKGLDKKVKVAALAGDGATFDIGIGLISGMWERNDNILYVCFDTEVYSNTGYQASGATPHDAFTRTSWPDKKAVANQLFKKNMVDIALAHNIPYVASTTSGYVEDIRKKVKKSLEFQGSKFIHILTPCIPGWGLEDDQAIEIGKLAQKTGFFPVLEYINGQLVSAMKVPQQTPPVDEYLKPHARFKHLFKDAKGKAGIKILQEICNLNIEKYKLK